jgi:hypothetical protein
LFTLFVVPVFYSLIASQHQPVSNREEREVREESDYEGLLVAGSKG